MSNANIDMVNRAELTSIYVAVVRAKVAPAVSPGWGSWLRG